MEYLGAFEKEDPSEHHVDWFHQTERDSRFDDLPDGLKSFTGVREAGYHHVARTQPLRIDLRKGANVVPLADLAIGNLQEWLIETHHGVGRDHLQAYLVEFVFRHNRRKTPMVAFQTMLGLGAGRGPTAYARLRGAKNMLEAPDHNI